jgi:copper chaperone
VEDFEMERVVLSVSGMSCGHCVSRVQKALSALDGVKVQSVRVGEADVEYDPSRQSPATLVQSVEKAGYTAAVR